MATKIKAGFVIGAAVVAVTASVGTAVYFSRPAVPAGVALPVTVLTSDTPATTEKAPIVTERSRISAGDWQGYRRVSPFEAIQWKGDVPEVQVAGKQYELAAVNDVAAKDMVEFAKGADRDWQKRFNEDFVALLTLMGHAPGATVTLKVKDAQAGAEELLKDVTMTKENRDAIWTARNK